MFTHGCSFAQDPERKRQSDAKADGHGLKRPRASVGTLLWHIEKHELDLFVALCPLFLGPQFGERAAKVTGRFFSSHCVCDLQQ